MADYDIEATFVQGDRKPSLQANLHAWGDDSDIEDLTGATVAFQMRKPDDRQYTVNAAATVVGDPTEGNVRYDWAVNDLAVIGTYLCQWQITYGDGKAQTTRPRYIEVRRQ